MPPAEPCWTVAHRGFHRDHPENTLEAFRAAYAAGCDLVEFDVQLSRDGIPVIFHDDDARRLAGVDRPLHSLDAAEALGLRLQGNGPSTPPDGYHPPSLSGFLAEFRARPYYLELKVPADRSGDPAYWRALAAAAAAMVRDSSPHPDTFLASFHLDSLAHLRSGGLFPRLAAIFESVRGFRAFLAGADGRDPGLVDYFSLSWKVYRACREEILRRGLAPRTLIWDIAGAAAFRWARADGVRGLVSDDVTGMVAGGGR